MDAASTTSSEGGRRKRHQSGDDKANKKRKHQKNANGERRGSFTAPPRDPRDVPERQKKKAKKSKTKEPALPEEQEEEVAADDTKHSNSNGSATRSPSPVIDFDGLSRPSLGTRERLEETKEQADKRLSKMCGAVRTLLECVGEDVNREGVLATPERYAKAMLFFTKGYQQNVKDIVNGAIFKEGHNEMVIVKDIEVFSMCEHHLVPFTGKVSPSQTRIWSKHGGRGTLTAVLADAHRLYSRPVCHWHLKITQNRRDVRSPVADSRAVD